MLEVNQTHTGGIDTPYLAFLIMRLACLVLVVWQLEVCASERLLQLGMPFQQNILW